MEEILKETGVKLPVNDKVKAKARENLFSRLMKLLCSVRLGIVLLILLGLSCLVGMLIVQENVDGFANYYATLTPAQRLVYGKLDFFDIYHSWYFNALLLFLSLNIILASIDRFPKTWALVAKPNLTVPPRWLRDQKQSAEFSWNGRDREEISGKIAVAFKKAGWKKPVVTEKGGRTFVFAQSGAWNRLGAYAVHVGLLTIFLGGFLTTQLGTTGNMPLAPGQTSNQMFETAFELDQVKQFSMQLPFAVECADIEQKLIRKEGSLAAGNTIDWLTRIRIKDGSETREATVQMNRPFDYRGYRFFQASFVSTGRARNITVRATPAAGGGQIQDVTIPRNGASVLPDGTNIKFAEFRGNFRLGQEDPNEDTSSYPNPGAVLQITTPEGAQQIAYAFGPQMANIPAAKNPVGGYTYQLVDFEKVADQHILSVQYDPGANVVYAGFAILCLTLIAVFFFSHQRVWAAIEPAAAENSFRVTIAGSVNRNQNGFDEKFQRFIKDLREQNKEIEKL
jgi:cytochrome c biogenesis protein